MPWEKQQLHSYQLDDRINIQLLYVYSVRASQDLID